MELKSQFRVDDVRRAFADRFEGDAVLDEIEKVLDELPVTTGIPFDAVVARDGKDFEAARLGLCMFEMNFCEAARCKECLFYNGHCASRSMQIQLLDMAARQSRG